MPALILKSGPDAGKRFEIDSGVVVVGRGEVDCVIDDAELSRKHVTVRAAPGGLEVEDLGSLNGTWFKGKRLEGATVIPDGGVIRLGGKIELLVEVAVVNAPADTSKTVAAPVVAPPAAAVEAPPAPVEEPPPPAAPEVVSEGPPPTNIPAKARASAKAPAAPAAPDASTVPPRRRAAPPSPPSPKSRRGAPPRDGAASEHLGAFKPPSKPGRRKVATRLVLPAFLTFAVIFLTAIALIAYFAAR